jgi:hypothetical protein
MQGSQHIQADGSGNIIVQLRGDHNRVNVEGLPHLTLTNFPSRRSAPKTELDLLDPFRRSIEHLGREQDMAVLVGRVSSRGDSGREKQVRQSSRNNGDVQFCPDLACLGLCRLKTLTIKGLCANQTR